MYHYVYLITHIETGEFYYGSRSSECHPSLDDYMGSMQKWKPDKNKLKKEILRDDFETRKEANEYEVELIKGYIQYSLNRNYAVQYGNIYPTGDKNPSKRPEVREKISEANKGREISEEQKRKHSEIMKGRKHSEEHRNKMSKALKGRKHSEETKKILSKKHKGKEINEEQRRKMSEVKKGRKHSEETKQKISNSEKGKKNSEEHNKKISKSNKGKEISEESREKMSESQKKKMWIKNESTGETIRINKEDSIPEGWERGRIFSKK